MGQEEDESIIITMSSESTQKATLTPKLTLLPLIALIFYEVSGGPFGIEDSVRAGWGPSLPLLGFLIFPLIWSIPEALITAELATAYPENGGYVVWVSSGFGPIVGFPRRVLEMLAVSLAYLNYRGLNIVGLASVALAGFSLFPFLVMSALAIPRIKARRWLVVDFKVVDWRGYFNYMFWNKASTLVAEIEDPSRTFPKAIFGAMILVVLSYLIPLLAGTGAYRSDAGEWTDGYFAEVGMLVGGSWLRWLIQAGSAMPNLGLFEAEMSSDAFQLLGMSELGMLPGIFAARSRYGTPTFSIICSATGVIFLSWMTFQEILEFLNFRYSVAMLLEFATFIYLRIKKPDLQRPYRVPVQTFGAILICMPPAFLLIRVMCLASLKKVLVSSVVIVMGFFAFPFLAQAKNAKWTRVDAEQPILPSMEPLDADISILQQHEVNDETTVSLLS
ncbi:putative polyamine transporter [Drosera capensis]